MLHVHFSNRLEALAACLLERLDGERPDVFERTPIVVPSAAMRRHLTLAIADAHGVCAQVEFAFLARWLWQQVASRVPGVSARSPFEPEALAWRVHRAFGDAAFVAAHPRLHSYLEAGDDVMRLELSRQVAGVLEQYVTYRPQWLEAWQRGRPAEPGAAAGWHADEAWQAALWRRIAAEIGLGASHPAQAFFASLAGAAAGGAAGPTLHVFAPPAIAPLHLGWLVQLSRHRPVALYVLNPCREYWGDVIDAARLARLAVRGRAAGQQVGNRLLAGWGRPTQALVDSLIEVGADAVLDDDRMRPAGGATLLARLQDAILDLRELEPGSIRLDDEDRSIEVHVAHSTTRELEVLHDRLLDLFARDPALRPGDVAVVTPDLEAAAPLVDAVFGTVPEARRIPYAISGRARTMVSAPARALVDLLALAGSRCTASEVFGVLQQPVVARRFGLAPASLADVHRWLQEAGVRWGLDAAHRAGFGLPAVGRHTWQDGLERLVLGHALPLEHVAPYGEQLPAGDAQGTRALALGGLWRFVEALRALQQRVSRPHAATGWERILLDVLDGFVDADAEELEDRRDVEGAVRALAQTLREAGFDAPGEPGLSLAVMRSALERALDDPARGGVPTGAVTFSSMAGLRGLPFAVVCAIGLNDGAFPASGRLAEFDLMAGRPRRGDRDRRADDRNVFLDLLLAARRHLVLSYTGRSVRDNAQLPPSVLVSELLDVLVPAIADERARERLVVEHPLQPFAVEPFLDCTPEPRRSFAGEIAAALRHGLQAAAARAASPAAGAGPDRGGRLDDDRDGAEEGDAADEDTGSPEASSRFFLRPLPPPEPAWREVSVDRLVEFLRGPCRVLLRRRLGIALRREVDELQDDEPFVPGQPGERAMAQRAAAALLDGETPATARRRALAGVEAPHGAVALAWLDREWPVLTRFADRVRLATAEPALPPRPLQVEVDLEDGRWTLQGTRAGWRSTGLVRWRYGGLRAGDVLEAWVQHLLLCLDAPPGVERRTRWIAIDDELVLRAVDEPGRRLADLLDLYRRGLREPLRFFPRSSWARVDSKGGLKAARQTWAPAHAEHPGEGTEPAHELAWRGVADPLDAEFERIADFVFGPVLEHREAST